MKFWRRRAFGALALITVIISGCGTQSGVNAVSKRGIVRAQVNNLRSKFYYFDKIDQGLGSDVARRVTELVWGTNVKTIVEGRNRRADAFDQLKSEKVDLVIDSWTSNGEDLKGLHASPPFYVDSLRVMVRASSGIKQVTELDGKRVAYVKEQVAQVPQYLKDKYPQMHLEFEQVFSYANPPLGRTVALVGPTSELVDTLDSKVIESYHLMLLPERVTTWNYSVYVRAQDNEVAKAVDKAIRQMTESGELDQLIKKWGLDI